ncbi:MAG: hypothetical protein R2769_14850 [Saprospiraceae bacterium]
MIHLLTLHLKLKCFSTRHLDAGAGCNIEDCSNGIDDDGDGLIDCDDPDCTVNPDLDSN